ncbi:MAG: sensor histidine kinase [Jiangellaceae bacterium]
MTGRHVHADLLVRIACHELRGPVSTLRGLLDLLVDPRLDDASRAAAAGLARANVDHLASMLDLLADGELLAGRDDEPPPRPLCEVLGEAARGRPRVTLRTVTGPVSPLVDPVRVRRIVDNLIDNSAVHGPVEGDIVVEGSGDGEHAVVVVSDSGTLPSSLTSALSATDPPPGPRGLGLWIVGALTRQLNGSVVARDLEARGVAVEVRLPCNTPVPSPAGQRRPREDIGPG